MKYAVILAGGSGLRAGGEIPKQFHQLNGIPLLWWSVRRFYEADPATSIKLVMHPGYYELWQELYSSLPESDRDISVELIDGGKDRLESVQHGIAGISSSRDVLIAVHDAARPLTSVEMIKRGWDAAQSSGAAIPCVAMTDSIRKQVGEKTESVARKDYMRVQTPQMFRADMLKYSYSQPLTALMTDDASVVESAGFDVAIYAGEESNMKVTNPIDFKIAEALMRE